MNYTCRELPDGGAVVLEPDGLTWTRRHPSLAEAWRHAAALNDWLADKPETGEPELLLEAFTEPVSTEPRSCSELAPELERILARLAGPYDARLPRDRRQTP